MPMKMIVCTGMFCLVAGFVSNVSAQTSTPLERLRQRLEDRRSAQADFTTNIVVGTNSRTYHVHLPPGYNATNSLPLVLAFHGGTGQGSGMNTLTGLSRVADRENMIVVYPEGIDRHWNDGRDTLKGMGDDVAFVRALLDRLAADYHIDRKRVYATGISNGGFFTQRLACELPDRFAAIAAVAATLPEGYDCHPAHPISVMMIHGTDDPFVPFNGGELKGHGNGMTGYGGRALSVSNAASFWIKHNEAKPIRSMDLPDADPKDGTTVNESVYSGTNAEVIVYVIKNGGHTWPGGMQYAPESLIGKTCRDFNASEAIIEFFKRHELK